MNSDATRMRVCACRSFLAFYNVLALRVLTFCLFGKNDNLPTVSVLWRSEFIWFSFGVKTVSSKMKFLQSCVLPRISLDRSFFQRASSRVRVYVRVCEYV